MHLGGLLSTQEARVADFYASFVLSNLPRASITPWLHAARFLIELALEPLLSNLTILSGLTTFVS